MASLQDQLLKAGIVDKKKAKAIKQAKTKQARQQVKGQPVVDESKEAAQKALAAKAARDREINRQKEAEANAKALRAQIVQLVSMNRISREGGDVAYQFTDDKKIKKMHVTPRLQQQLISGVIAIVRFNDSYELVPAGVADKIRQRDETTVVLHNTRSTTEIAEDDPYAEYQIPDDLMW